MNQKNPTTSQPSNQRPSADADLVRGISEFLYSPEVDARLCNKSEHRRVALEWQGLCDNWEECSSRLDESAHPQGAWTAKAALESAEPGLPPGGLSALLFDRVRSVEAFTGGGLLFPDRWQKEADSDYAVGVAFLHDSTDFGMMTMKAFVFRRICQNGLIWGGRAASGTLGFGRREAPEDVAEQVRCYIGPILEGGESLRAALMETTHIILNDPFEFIRRDSRVVARALGIDAAALSKSWQNGLKLTMRERGRFRGDSLFAVVNGLTRAAQAFDVRTRWRLEEVAGLMVMNQGKCPKLLPMMGEGSRPRATRLPEKELSLV